MHDIAWLSLTGDDVPAGDDWLGAAEREVQARLRVPKRRHDWRLGRYTAKRALAAWLAAPGGSADAATPLRAAQPLTLADVPATLLAQLEVLAAPDGAPEGWRDGRRLPLALSISHSHGRSLVALGPPDSALGCDIERVQSRSAAFVADYFTPDEQAFVSTRADSEQALWATLIWSAKESTLKALRQGLRLPTRAVEVYPTDVPIDSVDSERTPARWRGLKVVVRPDGPRFNASWRVIDASGGFITTLVCARRGAGPEA